MKSAILAIVIAAGAVGLTACETVPTRYAAAVSPNAPGFIDYRIEPGRYRITFRGGAGAPPQQVEDFALLRASEIALQEGYDWFEVVQGYGERLEGGRSPRVSIGIGSASFGRRSSMGVGVGSSFDVGGGAAFSRSIEVVLGKGARPERPGAYDARGVRDSIRPRV